MNGTVYGNVKTSPFHQIIDDHTVPQQPTYDQRRVTDPISGGGEKFAVTDALTRAAMYENDRDIWSPLNKTAAYRMAFPKPDGPISTGNMDPVINGSQVVKNTKPVQMSLDRAVTNFF